MQLNSSKKIVGGLALAVALALAAINGIAQQATTQGQQEGGAEKGARQWRRGGGRGHHRGMRGGFHGRFAEQLNLTEAQKEQLKQIAARYRQSIKALREQARASAGARRGGQEPFNGGAFDEAAVRAAATARANLRVEMEVQRARMMSEMFAVLTPEQQAQLAAARQQFEQKRRARRGAGATAGQSQ